MMSRLRSRRIKVSVLKIALAIFLLVGCQSRESKKGSSIVNTAQKPLTVFGVSPELHQEAGKEGEKAKKELELLKKDGSLSGTVRRILAEGEEAKENGDEKLYLAKIQEAKRRHHDESLKRLAELSVLEGRVLFSQLKLKEAQQAIEEAVKLDSRNPEYLLLLAEYRQWNREYKGMLEVSLKAMSMIKERESSEEILLADGYSSLGRAYWFSGNYNSALEPLQQSLEMRKKMLGEKHPDVASSLNNLANLYSSQGKYEKAKPLLREALEMSKKMLGEEHPDVASSLNNLAVLYDAEGKDEKAEPLYVEALEMKRKVLGEEHPSVATSINNLAGLYDAQGRYEQAELLYVEALKLFEKLLGENHPNTKTVRKNYQIFLEEKKERVR